jgi:hypothetical protein
MRTRRREAAARVALFVLLAFATGLLGAFIHTDDGCAVEQHCRACRVAVASVGTPPATASVLPVVRPAEAVVASGEARPRSAPLASHSNRGPPAAL